MDGRNLHAFKARSSPKDKASDTRAAKGGPHEALEVMIRHEINGLTLYFFEKLMQYDALNHFLTTRLGGCSGAPWDSFNLSFRVGDDCENVSSNRRLLAETIGISRSALIGVKQVHDTHVKVIKEASPGPVATDSQGGVDLADAMVTNVPGICPMVLVADCVPILMYDPVKKVVGAVHAGWKGTLGSITKRVVEVFTEQFGSSSPDIIAGIGPSIGPCCLRVGPEVAAMARDAFGSRSVGLLNMSPDGAALLNLWRANQQQLLESGLDEKHIEIAHCCTCCNKPSLFFSYRKGKGETGRFGAGIMMC